MKAYKKKKKNSAAWQFFIFICLLCPSALTAQGEWRWTVLWSGNDGYNTQYYNRVIRTAFDEDGNIYVLGKFGGNAELHDGHGWDYICDSMVVAQPNYRGMILAKFDTLGNLQWRKVFKVPGDGVIPKDMVLKDGLLHLVASVQHEEDGFAQYWDTVFFAYDMGLSPIYPYFVYNPPYTRGCYTYFANFDLDGNLQEDHFVKALPRVYYSYLGVVNQGVPLSKGLGHNDGRMCVDSQGNTYLAVSGLYYGSEELPFYVVVDEDSTQTYILHFPGSTSNSDFIPNLILYKFTPNWELVWGKPLIDHLGLPSGRLPLDSLRSANYFIEGFSIDSDDNLYLSGRTYNVSVWGNDTGESPLRLYWDSTRYLESIDTSGLLYTSFINKYDSDGNLLWNNQPSLVRSPTDNDISTEAHFFDNVVKDDYVYVIGCARYSRDGGMIFFNTPNNKFEYTNETQYGAELFVRYNKNNGEFVNYGQLPTETCSDSRGGISIINNHIFAGSMIGFYPSTPYIGLGMWNENGQFMGMDTFYSEKLCQNINVLAKETGTLLCSMQSFSNVRFSNGLSTEGCSSTKSNAVLALYHNSDYSTPFPVGIAEYREQKDLHIYPNPTSNLVHVDVSEDISDYTISVYDMQGRLVGIFRESQIDVSDLSPGIYTVNVLSTSYSLTGKLVIER
mgnify:CR=1 FL=1